MIIKNFGEFNLIEKLTSILSIKDPDVLVGFGDDCACVKVKDELLLFSSDTQVEDVHFLKNRIKPHDLGWKIISVNVSDIVACGGLPEWSLITVGTPETVHVEFLEDVYRGIKEALDFYSFSLIGGNTTKSKNIFFDLFITGKTDRFVSRSGAKEGDILYLSGYTGLSRAGLELLLMNKNFYENWEERLIKYHTCPIAEINFHEIINKYASSCIDISDGLAADAGHIEKQSRVKIVFEIEKIPIHPLLEKYCKKYNKNIYDYIFYGGEDYRLLFTIPKNKTAFIKKGFQVGYIEKGKGIFVKESSSLKRLEEKGFQHL